MTDPRLFLHFTTRRNPEDHSAVHEVEERTIAAKPPFDVWLADRNAKAQVLGNSIELLAWIDDKLDDDALIPLMERLGEIRVSPAHVYVAIKHHTDDAIWVGQTEDLGEQTVTVIHLPNIKDALKP